MVKKVLLAAFSGITKLGDVDEGKWRANVIDTTYGGTGATSVNEFLTINGLRPDYEGKSHYPALELIGQLFSISSRFEMGKHKSSIMPTADASGGKIIYTVEDENEELGIDFKTANVSQLV